jgi:anti-sigma factor RsiW
MNRIAESAESDEKSEHEGKKKFSWRWLNYVLPPLATAVAGVIIVLALLPKYYSQIDMEEQIVSAHVRSLIEDNLTHIESADTHQVEPWFKGKVDFVATAKDLTENGFVLKGGRLDYVNKTNAASIIYEYQEHVINLFIFPTTEADMESVKTLKSRGYNIVRWTNNGLEYCVISDLNIEYLKKFAEFFRAENSISRIDANITPITKYLSANY